MCWYLYHCCDTVTQFSTTANWKGGFSFCQTICVQQTHQRHGHLDKHCLKVLTNNRRLCPAECCTPFDWPYVRSRRRTNSWSKTAPVTPVQSSGHIVFRPDAFLRKWLHSKALRELFLIWHKHSQAPEEELIRLSCERSQWSFLTITHKFIHYNCQKLSQMSVRIIWQFISKRLKVNFTMTRSSSGADSVAPEAGTMIFSHTRTCFWVFTDTFWSFYSFMTWVVQGSWGNQRNYSLTQIET